MGDEQSKPPGDCTNQRHLDNDNTFFCEDGTCNTTICRWCCALIGKKRVCRECKVYHDNKAINDQQK